MAEAIAGKPTPDRARRLISYILEIVGLVRFLYIAND